MNCYQFSFHSNVSKTPPKNEITELLDKAFTDEPLTRQEKDRIAEIPYGLFGANSSTYKLVGWAWPMAKARQMRRVLVKFRHDPGCWIEYWAPDKTSLRRALPDHSQIVEMVYA